MKSRMSLAGLIATLALALGAGGTFALSGEFSSNNEDTARGQYGCDNSNRPKNHEGEHPCQRSCEETPRSDRGQGKGRRDNGRPPHCENEGSEGNGSAGSRQNTPSPKAGAGKKQR